MIVFFAAFAATATLPTTWHWLLAVVSIVLIDIVLAADNAVAVAFAVRKLGSKRRLIGMTLGTLAAVALRIALTSIAAHLLAVAWAKSIGGVMILWIAAKLVRKNSGSREARTREASSLWQAIGLITLADLTMSLDNVLAIAAASHGSFGLLIFGQALSISMVVFISHLLVSMMDRYPLVIYIGGAILGHVGSGMVITDKFVLDHLQPACWVQHAVRIAFGALLLLVPVISRNRENKSKIEPKT